MIGIEQIEIILLAVVVAVACALPGVFLVLRKVSLLSDAISHAILLGIVVAFFAVRNLHSPILIIGATITGILTVTFTEMVIQTGRVKKDAAIGLIFPVFFSIGVILISRYAGKIHLDQDAVLLGEIAFAPFNRFILAGMDLGPIGLWTMGGIMLLNIGFIVLYYKELKISTFDAGLAATLGFSPFFLHYALMTLVSITAVGAFDAVGSILVVALMITPPAAAYLLTEKLSAMLILSSLIGMISAVLGYGMAYFFDASIAGSMATMTGIIFIFVLFLSPSRGLVPKYLRAKEQKMEFGAKMLVVQLLYHEGSPQEEKENTVTNMIRHMEWDIRFARLITKHAVQKDYIQRQGNKLNLTPLGREVARAAVEA